MTVKIELFTANFCPYCARARTALENAVGELGPDHFELRLVDVVQEIDHAVEVGVRQTPAIAVNGRLAGLRPTPARIKALLQASLRTEETDAALPHQ